MNRTQEKRQYKEVVRGLQDRLVTTLTDLKDNTRDEDKEISKANIAAVKADLDEAKDKLKMFMMNKTGSKFFEWIPDKHPNRRARKLFKKTLNKR